MFLYFSFWFWLPYSITLQTVPFILLCLNQRESTTYRLYIRVDDEIHNFTIYRKTKASPACDKMPLSRGIVAPEPVMWPLPSFLLLLSEDWSSTEDAWVWGMRRVNRAFFCPLSVLCSLYVPLEGLGEHTSAKLKLQWKINVCTVEMNLVQTAKLQLQRIQGVKARK